MKHEAVVIPASGDRSYNYNFLLDTNKGKDTKGDTLVDREEITGKIGSGLALLLLICA